MLLCIVMQWLIFIPILFSFCFHICDLKYVIMFSFCIYICDFEYELDVLILRVNLHMHNPSCFSTSGIIFSFFFSTTYVIIAQKMVADSIICFYWFFYQYSCFWVFSSVWCMIILGSLRLEDLSSRQRSFLQPLHLSKLSFYDWRLSLAFPCSPLPSNLEQILFDYFGPQPFLMCDVQNLQLIEMSCL